MIKNLIDVKENKIYRIDKELLKILLKDRSSEKEDSDKDSDKEDDKKNIIWATDNYASRGFGYQRYDHITVQSITGYNGSVIKPRVNKSKKEQIERIKQKAEVFTPSWICNKQNNLVDNDWFGIKNVFNTEGDEEWLSSKNKIPFPTPTGKTWQDYVLDTRLEIACGEAPYLASRYDTVTGEYIEVESQKYQKTRIGMLDRKLLVVSENVNSEVEWVNWAITAFQNIYGFDWQGDNILLARENLLFTFVDYYQANFGKRPTNDMMKEIAYILSWNIWQMDGLKYVIPESCKDIEAGQLSLFDEQIVKVPCPGCVKNDPKKHTGIYCWIYDWKDGKEVRFVDLL